MKGSRSAPVAFVCAALAACGPVGNAPGGPDASGSSSGGTPGVPTFTPSAIGDAYTLRPEWNGPCVASLGAIDVNLGNAPEAFIAAAYCQIHGAMPPADTVTTWASQLRSVPYVRRVDVVRTLCQQAGRTCALFYSNPWATEALPTSTCARTNARDVGAVMMFSFQCPGGTNCDMDGANTHGFGMLMSDPTYGFGSDATGFYTPTNEGFWVRELLDARYAGLQFVLPNVYGYDIDPSTGEVARIEAALQAVDALGGGMRVGLFNDTWAWGKPAGGALMNPAPSLANTEDAAQRIYAVQWKPFFQGIARAHWYTVNGAPLVYFYNAGTLTPGSGATAVVARMKQLFAADFGVAPFVDVDHGYGAVSSADAQFTWDTFTSDPSTHLNVATSATGGLTLANAMVKWDSLDRDSPGAVADASTRMVKGPSILQSVLQSAAGANVLVLETWNDLFEGTGITRNYDYYDQGAWLPPDAFMHAIRASQCSN
jgi:hypothetical protein